MQNPYSKLPEEKFWKLAIASRHMFDIQNLWNPKYKVKPTDKVATFGSCFAQHIGRALKSRNFAWYIAEKAPKGLSDSELSKYNYNIFSCRTGNIYTTSLLLQWVEWALELNNPPDEYWEDKGRIYDPFRPNIEPDGFRSVEEMINSRDETISSLKDLLYNCDVFVFTLGLTESWFNKQFGYEYPMCPGTVAGEFNKEIHVFRNQQVGMVQNALIKALKLIKGVNPNVKILLTVSPVPLTATKSSNHVLVATMHSKSILRAVAGQLSINHAFIDYFPSYEIINSPVFGGIFFDPNKRNVNINGVDFVMNHFFKSLGYHKSESVKDESLDSEFDEVVCEEELLNAFINKK